MKIVKFDQILKIIKKLGKINKKDVDLIINLEGTWDKIKPKWLIGVIIEIFYLLALH